MSELSARHKTEIHARSKPAWHLLLIKMSATENIKKNYTDRLKTTSVSLLSAYFYMGFLDKMTLEKLQFNTQLYRLYNNVKDHPTMTSLHTLNLHI